MANINYNTTKDKTLTAKIQVSIKQNDKYKIVYKYIRNDDNLTEAKFRKFVEREAANFEQDVKLKESMAEDAHIRIFTFKELAAEFLDNVKQNLSISYYKTSKNVIDLFNKYLDEHNLQFKPISELTVRDVQSFLNSFKTYSRTANKTAVLIKPLPKSVDFSKMVKEKVVSHNCEYYLKKGSGIVTEKAQKICDYNNLKFDTYFSVEGETKNFSEVTIKGYRRLLRTIFNEAVRYDWIAKNPVCNTKVGASKGNGTLTPIKEKSVFSLAEAQEFAAALSNDMDDTNMNMRVPIKLMLLTGIRCSEMCGLRWEDIDLENQVVHVRRCRMYHPEFGIYEKEPKTQTSQRDVPILPDLIPDLERYKDWFRIIDDDFDNKLDKYYFATDGKREPILREVFAEYLRRFEISHGFKKIPPHGLRHTYCSLLLSQNVPIQTVSKYMGHSKSNITLEVYSHFIPDTKEKAINALGIIVNKK